MCLSMLSSQQDLFHQYTWLHGYLAMYPWAGRKGWESCALKAQGNLVQSQRTRHMAVSSTNALGKKWGMNWTCQGAAEEGGELDGDLL